MRTLRDFHATWAYVAIVVNGLVGVAGLVAWRVPRLRGRWLLFCVLAAAVTMVVQIVVGVILQASKDYKAPDFHIFYGILVFLTLGLLYEFRFQLRGRREMLFGVACLFIMGLGIRAVLQVS
jgi:hypothetical protein